MSLSISTAKIRGGVAFNKKDGISGVDAPIDPTQMSQTYSFAQMSPASIPHNNTTQCVMTVNWRNGNNVQLTSRRVGVNAFGVAFTLSPVADAPQFTDGLGKVVVTIIAPVAIAPGNYPFQVNDLDYPGVTLFPYPVLTVT